MSFSCTFVILILMNDHLDGVIIQQILEYKFYVNLNKKLENI